MHIHNKMLKTSLIPIKNHILSKKERFKERNDSLKRFQEWQQIKVKWRQDIARSRGLFLSDLFCANTQSIIFFMIQYSCFRFFKVRNEFQLSISKIFLTQLLKVSCTYHCEIFTIQRRRGYFMLLVARFGIFYHHNHVLGMRYYIKRNINNEAFMNTSLLTFFCRILKARFN